jgi:hypothetical protein
MRGSEPRPVSGMFGTEDGAAAILISDASRLGLIRGKIDRSLWNRSLSADGLRSPMWLHTYESALKGLNGTTSVAHVTGDPYFGPIFGSQVEFYRSGSSHLSVNALLRRLRNPPYELFVPHEKPGLLRIRSGGPTQPAARRIFKTGGIVPIFIDRGALIRNSDIAMKRRHVG